MLVGGTTWGEDALLGILALALAYLGVGISLQVKAFQAAGKQWRSPAELLPPQILLMERSPPWRELPTLVLDGIAYCRLRLAGGGGDGGGGGYAPVTAAAAMAAPTFKAGDQVEYKSSKGWKLTVVTGCGSGAVDTAIKPGVKDMRKLRAVRVVTAKASSSSSSADKNARERLEKERAKLEKDKKKLRQLKEGAKADAAAAKDAKAEARAAKAKADAAAKRAAKRDAERDGAGGGGGGQHPKEGKGGQVWVKADRQAAKDAGLL